MNGAKLGQRLLVGLVALLFGLKVYQQSLQATPGATAENSSAPTIRTDASAPQTEGAFDYYVLSLSWSPQYCATEARPNDSQCERPYAFVAHGLWPQNEQGYPEHCGRGEYLENDLIADLLPIMPSKSLIIHEWQKHGTCSGLSAARYFDTLQRAYRSVHIPPRYQQVSDYLSTSAADIEADFIAANPGLDRSMLAMQCKGQYLQELRVCLTKNLKPRTCSRELRDRCGQQVVLRPTR